MTVRQIQGQVQGHKDAKGFHEITYYIPSGIQIVSKILIFIKNDFNFIFLGWTHPTWPSLSFNDSHSIFA